MDREDWATAIRTPIGMIPSGSGNGMVSSVLHCSGYARAFMCVCVCACVHALYCNINFLRKTFSTYLICVCFFVSVALMSIIVVQVCVALL